MSNTVIDVDAKVIEIRDWRDEPSKVQRFDGWANIVFYYGLILPMAGVGLVMSLLWLAAKAGIGHFVLYYGALPYFDTHTATTVLTGVCKALQC